MYGPNEYAKQTVEGEMDFNSGVFTTTDGKRWKSIGYLDYGNNIEYEVMALEVRPQEFEESFRHFQYPIYLASHDNGMEDLGMPLPEFMAEMATPEWSHHLPSIISQIGHALSTY